MNNDKQQMLNDIKKEWENLLALLKTIPNNKLETPIPAGGWSPKDVMGHITTWEDIVSNNLKSLLAGIKYVKPYSDYNAYNDQEIARKRWLSLADVKNEFDESHADLLKLLDTLPDGYFKPGSDAAKLIHGETAKHYAGHVSDMQKFMKSRRSKAHTA